MHKNKLKELLSKFTNIYYNDDYLNNLINEETKTIKEITQNRFYNEELLTMLIIAFTIFRLYYGQETKSILETFLANHPIYYLPYNNETYGLFDYYFENLFTSQKPIIKKEIKLYTYSNNKELSHMTKLEILIHELRHVLTSYYNSGYYLNADTFYYRGGLLEEKISRESESRTSDAFDEAINSHMTYILLNYVVKLKKVYLDNKSVRQFLSEINLINNDVAIMGYSNLLNLLEPLLLNTPFLDFTDQRTVDGNINAVKYLLDNSSTYGDYNTLTTYLDKILQSNQTNSAEYQGLIKKTRKLANDFANNIK